MMFSTLPPHKPSQRRYTPHHPSPLSSSPLRNSPSPFKDRNANQPFRNQIMSSPTPSKSTFFNKNPSPIKPKQELPMSPPPSRSRNSNFSGRKNKPNPLVRDDRGKADERETRRRLFLKRVRENSEDKKWRDRRNGMGEGEEEVLRAIWVAEERRREARMMREASSFRSGDEIEEVEEEAVSVDERMADEVQREEEREMEYLLKGLGEDEDMFEDHTIAPRPETPYGSDDEEYDHIFMDVIEEEFRASQQQPAYVDQDINMVDMS